MNEMAVKPPSANLAENSNCTFSGWAGGMGGREGEGSSGTFARLGKSGTFWPIQSASQVRLCDVTK